MSKFHVGDHVRIKSKEQLTEQLGVSSGNFFYYPVNSGGITFRSTMWQYCGCQFTLEEHYRTTNRWWRHDVQDGAHCWWDEDWLELVEAPITVSNSDLEELL